MTVRRLAGRVVGGKEPAVTAGPVIGRARGSMSGRTEAVGTAGPVSGRALFGYTAAKVVPGLLTFAAIPIVIHVIGIAQYALFSTVWALTLFTSSIGVGWLRHAGLRAAGDPSNAMGLLPRWSVVAAILLPAVLVVGWLATVGLTILPAHATAVMITSAVFCTSDGVYSVLATRAQRDLRTGRFAAAESVRTAVGLLAALVLCQSLLLNGAAGVLAGNAIGTLLGAIILCGPTRPRLLGSRHPAASEVLRSYWRYGWPMSLWLAASNGLVYVDRLVLGMLLNAETVGRYAAIADMVVRGIAMVAAPISMAVHPVAMIQWNSGHPRRATATLRTYAKVLATLLICCVVGLVLLAPWIVPRLVPAVSPTRGLVTLLAAGAALWQCGLLAQKVLEMSGRSRLTLTLMLFSAGITVASDAVLVPVMGPSGAALAFASGAACYLVGCLLSGRRVMRAYTSSTKL